MGLLDVLLRPLRSPIATRGYPPHADVPDRGHRGTPVLAAERCRASGDCATVCPTGAIAVRELRGGTAQWQLDYGMCIFCGRCFEACPEDAIVDTDEFELAGRERANVIAMHVVRSGTRD
ncbi:MAG: 4Fe-4S dicluster domain-containing protein [Chloroflexi bacterium]|nr:4Fe-4S dicluster domain-containing protein [Chloroflexota bacterium]